MKPTTAWWLVVLAGWLAAMSATGAATIYVDGRLANDCKGNYSVAARDGSGKDGTAYPTIAQAAAVAVAGDTVVIRAGTYHSAMSQTANDCMWPKNSGEPGNPIVFKAQAGEKVILGDMGEKYPGWDDTFGIAGAVITLKGISHIVIADIEVRKVTGWLFARKSDHVTIRNCTFADGLHDFKGTARIIYCDSFRFEGCSFVNSSGDCLQLEISDHTLVENCTFRNAAHSLLAVRGSSYNVIRNCRFDNPYFERRRAEKLVEIYDVKLDKRDPTSPVYEEPAYDRTKYNLFERNFFGYTPFRPDAAAQPAAMQFSGQNAIVRQNLYCNPLDYRDPNYPDARPGGIGVAMRWGGSWDGWNANRNVWIGEGIEAGYVTGNRFFNNSFFGYDCACVSVPADDVIKGMTLNPPPMEQKNPPRQFTKKFEFSDNEFKNNLMMPGKLEAHVNWGGLKWMAGKPAAVMIAGQLNGMRFTNNDFYAGPEFGAYTNWLLYHHTNYQPAKNPAQMDRAYPKTFMDNVQKDPLVEDVAKRDFHLRNGSPMIDAGAFLTTAAGAGTGASELVVKDAGYFYDGFGIEGEKGDLIQLAGSAATARIVKIDYAKHVLTLDQPLSWKRGQGVSLAYVGKAPDIGALEHGADAEIGPKVPKTPGARRGGEPNAE